MSRIGSPPLTPRRENSRQLPQASSSPEPQKHEGKFAKFTQVKKKLDAFTVKLSPKKKKRAAPTPDAEVTTTTTTTTTSTSTATRTARQLDLTASEPATRTGRMSTASNEVMAECVKMLLERLFEGDRYKVEACFELLARRAGNDEGTSDGRIAEALQNCPLNDLDEIEGNARSLLPKDEPLANGIQLGIATTLLALQLAEAVQYGEIAMVVTTLGRVLDAVPRDKLAGLIEPMPPSEARKTLSTLKELLETRERLETARLLLALAMNDVKS
jgi:hypothetical protein